MNTHVCDWLSSPLPTAPRSARHRAGARLVRSSASKLAAMAILLLPFAACSGGAETADTGVSAQQFQDMVVPEGFRLQDGAHQSHSRQEGDWRMGKFFYSGSALVAEAAGYVKQRMPQHNWQIDLEELSDPMQGRMRFVRGRYLAEYTFQRLEGTTQMIVDYKTDYSRR